MYNSSYSLVCVCYSWLRLASEIDMQLESSREVADDRELQCLKEGEKVASKAPAEASSKHRILHNITEIINSRNLGN